MMPLCTTTIRPVQSRCGWAFSSVGRPCVAHRVWPTPYSPSSGSAWMTSSRRESFPALRSLEATPNNLPQQLTSFIGREREVAEATELFRASVLPALRQREGFEGAQDDDAKKKKKRELELLAEAGIAQGVSTREQFRALVESRPVDTEQGRQQLALLLGIADSFTAVADYMAEVLLKARECADTGKAAKIA